LITIKYRKKHKRAEDGHFVSVPGRKEEGKKEPNRVRPNHFLAKMDGEGKKTTIRIKL